jgi:hypothetical protein
MFQIGDWSDTTAGGSHLTPTWKKNPKYILKFHYPVNTIDPCRIRITLAKYGPHWKNMVKKDTVGCMIGFYIFIQNKLGDLSQVYESVFSVDNELSTDPTFVLEQLGHDEVYVIMPTTYAEGKLGSFVLSLLSEFEFSIQKDSGK